MENKNLLPKLNRAQRRKLMNKVIFNDGTIMAKRKVKKSDRANEKYMDLLDYRNKIIDTVNSKYNQINNIEEDNSNEK